MPLEPGKSRAVVSHNISEMMHSGHPQKQAVAAALSNARRHPRGDAGVTVPATYTAQYPNIPKDRSMTKLDDCMDRLDALTHRFDAMCTMDDARPDAGRRDTKFERDLQDHEPRRVSGVRGVKSKPFSKVFRNQAHMEKWFDTEGGNHEVHTVERHEGGSRRDDGSMSFPAKRRHRVDGRSYGSGGTYDDKADAGRTARGPKFVQPKVDRVVSEVLARDRRRDNRA